MGRKRFIILAASCVALIGGLAVASPTVPAYADDPTPTPTVTATPGTGGDGSDGVGGGGHGGGT